MANNTQHYLATVSSPIPILAEGQGVSFLLGRDFCESVQSSPSAPSGWSWEPPYFCRPQQGLRLLGSGGMDSGGSKGPGGAVGAATWVATSNPVGFLVGTGVKVYGERSGNSKLEGRASDSAEEIAELLKVRFRDQGWIS